MKGFIIVFAMCFMAFGATAYAEDALLPDELFEDHSAIMLLIDSETGDIVDANNTAVAFYGYDYDELVLLNISQINTMSEEDIALEMKAVVNKEKNYYQFTHKIKDGSIKDVEVYTSPIMDENGKTILISIVHDITNRVAAEKRTNILYGFVIGLTFVFLMIITLIAVNQTRLKGDANRIKRRYETLFENMKEGVALHEIILDKDGKPSDYRFVEVNPSFEEATGLLAKDILGRTVKEVLPITEDIWIEKYGHVALTGEGTSFENFSSALNKYFFVSVFSPKKHFFVTVFSDVTVQVIAKQKAENERALLETTLKSIGEGVISSDKNNCVDLMNQVAEILTGWSFDEAKGRKLEDVLRIDSDEIDKEEVSSHYQWLLRKDGSRLPVDFTEAPIVDNYGKDNGKVVVFRDYSERKQRIERIRYLSYHDQLTALYNRHFFEEELKRLDYKRNLPLSLVMLDVNGLKLTNDAFGHQAGDALLVSVAEAIGNATRKDEIIARIGGDEFVVLLPKTDQSEADAFVSRVQKQIEEKSKASMATDNRIVSVSIGSATKDKMEILIEDIFAEAEQRMYRQKLIESKKMRNDTINVIMTTLNKTNLMERKHSEQVGRLTSFIGEKLGLDNEQVTELEIAGKLHDIGKINISTDILYKEGPLNIAEYDEIKRHSEIGYHILRSVDEYKDMADYILCHHEWVDGKGYPRGFSENEIPLQARIIAVADAIEAMVSDRPYRKARTLDVALQELEKHAGTQFDPIIVSICHSHAKDLSVILGKENFTEAEE